MRKQASSLHKKRKLAKNSLLLDELIYTGEHKDKTELKLIQYGPEYSGVSIIQHPEAIPSLLKKDTVNWLTVSGLSDIALIEKVGEIVGIHPLDIQDILTTQHIAKIEDYEEKSLFLVNTFYYNDNGEFQQEHLCFILKEGLVISFQETEYPFFKNIIKAIELNSARIQNRTEDYLFSLLINTVLNNYITTIASLEDAISDMEDELTNNDIAPDFMQRIQKYRHDYVQLRKSILPLKDDFKKLIFNENELIKNENLIYINDLQDRLIFILQSLEVCRENISSLQELYVSNNDLRMNEIMKRLTVVATIFIPLTFVVGVWGMNFKFMPELEWQHGYFVAWIILIATALFAWWYIKKRKWY